MQQSKYPVRALVITGFGINCEEEMAAAYQLAGAETEIVHLNDILVKGRDIHTFDILNFPGGFSFGDDIASGKVLANKIRYKSLPNGNTFLEEINQFLADGKYIMGICNGFQVLVKLGLLPMLGAKVEQQVTLTHNNSGRYENRWVRCKVNPESKTPFLAGITAFDVPVRHGEGKLLFKDEATQEAIVSQHLNCLTYCLPNGETAEDYPQNPNGSSLACAGLTDPSGQVFGLMPHPEAFLSLYNHPNWAKLKRENPDLPEEGAGAQLFHNIVRHVAAKSSVTL